METPEEYLELTDFIWKSHPFRLVTKTDALIAVEMARKQEKNKWEKATLETIDKYGIKPRTLSEEEIIKSKVKDTALTIFEEIEKEIIEKSKTGGEINLNKLKAKWVKS